MHLRYLLKKIQAVETHVAQGSTVCSPNIQENPTAGKRDGKFNKESNSKGNRTSTKNG